MTTKSVEGIRPGDRAPDFQALDERGETHRLDDYKGKSVVLYFYPKDDTPGCTTEACGFRNNFDRYKKQGAVILGVSPDGGESHLEFKRKFNLPFPLLADTRKTLCRAYGVWKEKSMYGKKYMGVERSTFLIGPDGRIKALWRKVGVDGHVDEVLRTL